MGNHYRYEPAGPVGGDYCEVAAGRDGRSLFFAVGDVAGKGVAASLLMTHLSAIIRSLLSLELPLGEIMSRANRLFCESTMTAHYATLVCGRATGTALRSAMPATAPCWCCGGTRSSGSIPRVCRSVVLRNRVSSDPAESGRRREPGSVFDGVTESQDPAGNDFGADRLGQSLRRQANVSCGQWPRMSLMTWWDSRWPPPSRRCHAANRAPPRLTCYAW